eukprot:CAMPEP_0170498166 /NCGR_PEP_ID=MMETSP0208-20121228/27020_1 /TAXON_ID=197538 /ORGANISM="Strombidium inclinatum, Strain S3" /LENGTH=187 /DNA_ID=CAMNT_0010775259 /DNA_START=2751 /DNA_END=3314 /DNA_ORIENTATION=-
MSMIDLATLTLDPGGRLEVVELRTLFGVCSDMVDLFVFKHWHIFIVSSYYIPFVILVKNSLDLAHGLLLLLLLTSPPASDLTCHPLLFVVLADGFVDHIPLVSEAAHSIVEVVELKMSPRLRARVGLPAIRVLRLWVIIIVLAIVQHVDADEVYHRSVHDLSFAKLEGQVLVFLVLLRVVRIALHEI